MRVLVATAWLCACATQTPAVDDPPPPVAESASSASPAPAAVMPVAHVQIRADGVFFDGKRTARVVASADGDGAETMVVDAEDLDGERIPGLEEALSERMAEAHQNNPNQRIDGTLVLNVDPAVHFAVVRAVMFTGSRAGFTQHEFERDAPPP